MATVRDALIVAGGAGTRLRPLTATTPKPLLPFCGQPFLAGVLHRLAGVGVDHVRLVVGADPTPFEVLRPYADALGLQVTAVPEPRPLDTAGGVREVLDDLRGTTLVLNGDILTDVDLAGLLVAHAAAGAAATLTLTRVEDTSAFGVCVRDGRRIVDFVEKPAPGTLPGQDAVNAGTYVLEPAALERFPRGPLSFERDVFPGLVAAGAHVEGYVSDAVWADIGTPDRFLDGHRRALDGDLTWPSLARLGPAEEGVWRASDVEVAAEAQVRGPVMLDAGVRVDAGAVVGPYAVLGAGARVAAGARVTDTVAFAGVSIGAQASVTGGLLGRDVRVGAGARLRVGTVLGERSVVADGVQGPAGLRLDPGVVEPADAGGPEERA